MALVQFPKRARGYPADRDRAGQRIPTYYRIALLANGTTMPKFRGVLKGDQMNVLSSSATAGLPARSMISLASFTSLPLEIDLSSSSVVNAYGSRIFAALSP